MRVLFLNLFLALLAASARAYDPPGAATQALADAVPGEPQLFAKFKANVEAELGSHHRDFEVVMEDVAALPGGKLSELVPRISPGSSNISIVLRLTPAAKHSRVALLEEWTNIKCLYQEPNSALARYTNPFQWAEIYGNAQAGSAAGKEKLARTNLEAVRAVKGLISAHPPSAVVAGLLPPSSADLGKVNAYLTARAAEIEGSYKPVAKASRDVERAAMKIWNSAKPRLNALDKQEEKLNQLILKNDRVGVRKLVEGYLPWPLMEPSERTMWKRWLDAIEHPDPSHARITFRGLDDNLGLHAPDVKFAEVSTVLAKNQGNYNRRLRSLTTLRDRFGRNSSFLPRFLLPGTKDPVTISQMLENHSADPMGSPFLSSSNPSIAERFGKAKISMLRIDPRRLFENPMGFGAENEMIMPLILFPDEVLTIEAKLPNEDIDAFVSRFLSQCETKLGRSLSAEEANLIEGQVFRQRALAGASQTMLNQPALGIAAAMNCHAGYGAIGHH